MIGYYDEGLVQWFPHHVELGAAILEILLRSQISYISFKSFPSIVVDGLQQAYLFYCFFWLRVNADQEEFGNG